MRNSKRFLALLLCCLLVSPSVPAMSLKIERPFRHYNPLQSTHEAVELSVNCFNMSIASCVIEADKGTPAIYMTDELSFVWDGEEYVDELFFSYYDPYGKLLAKDCVTITGAIRYLLVHAEYGIK